MKIAISAETTVDLSKELIKENDIKIVPFTILLGDKSGLDGEITPEEIIEYVNKTKVLPKTSAVNQFQFDEHFSSLLKDYDAVIHFSLSSKMSSAYNNAVESAKKFKNVYVVDTLTLSTGIGVLALYARDLSLKGLDAETIYKKCIERVPYIQTSFELKRLDYLYKGGRCSGLMLFGANLLKIRPQIIVNSEGQMVPGRKYRGDFYHVVKNYCNDTLNKYNDPDLKRVFVTYTTADREIVDYVIGFLKDRGFENVYETRAGATITSHCGEDCLGLAYINDGGNK